VKYLAIILVGYLLGSMSPAALIAKLKNKNLREHGTGNLGATNTMLNFGKLYGAIVMIFDMAKAFISVKLAKLIMPGVIIAGLLGGGAAILGHCYPFYMKFKGGKGLASFGGMVLAYDPGIFFVLLTVTVIAMLTFNHSVAMPIMGATLFPFMAGAHDESLSVFLLAAAIGMLIIVKFIDNLKKAREGSDIKPRSFIKKTS